MKIKKLKGHPAAQCSIHVHADGGYTLVSYRTQVVVVTPDNWVYCTGSYSTTTRKHISWFAAQADLGVTSRELVGLYERAYKYNITTGEAKLLNAIEEAFISDERHGYWHNPASYDRAAQTPI